MLNIPFLFLLKCTTAIFVNLTTGPGVTVNADFASVYLRWSEISSLNSSIVLLREALGNSYLAPVISFVYTDTVWWADSSLPRLTTQVHTVNRTDLDSLQSFAEQNGVCYSFNLTLDDIYASEFFQNGILNSIASEYIWSDNIDSVSLYTSSYKSDITNMTVYNFMNNTDLGAIILLFNYITSGAKQAVFNQTYFSSLLFVNRVLRGNNSIVYTLGTNMWGVYNPTESELSFVTVGKANIYNIVAPTLSGCTTPTGFYWQLNGTMYYETQMNATNGIYSIYVPNNSAAVLRIGCKSGLLPYSAAPGPYYLQNFDNHDGGLSFGTSIGIIIGAVAFIIALGILYQVVVYYYRR
jgi:hypothetical protein